MSFKLVQYWIIKSTSIVSTGQFFPRRRMNWVASCAPRAPRTKPGLERSCRPQGKRSASPHSRGGKTRKINTIWVTHPDNTHENYSFIRKGVKCFYWANFILFTGNVFWKHLLWGDRWVTSEHGRPVHQIVRAIVNFSLCPLDRA